MQIKRFEAKDMTTALRQVKAELGADAVILSARSLRKGKGFFGLLKYAGVEVSAAVDNQLTAETYASRSASHNSYRRPKSQGFNNVGSTHPGFSQIQSEFSSTNAASRPKSGHGKSSSSRSSARALSSLYQQILGQEVDRGIASELIEEIKRIPASADILSDGDIKPHIASLLEDMGLRTATDPFVAGRQTILALVGTSGVGKTTTIAKLAALQAKANPGNVGLVTIDNYSIAGIQQLATYARIIGIPLQTAANAADLKKALKRFKNTEIILIDTPGINPKNKIQIQELKDCLAGVSSLKTQLVLNATTKDKDCIAISEAFQDVGIHQLLVTKTDESSTFGNIVNVLIQTNLPLAFLCGGRRVPDDVEAGSVQRLVDLLFNGHSRHGDHMADAANASEATISASEIKLTAQSYFIANRNSDVYHAPDCKWAQRIKPKNSVKFTDAQEAEAQNFLPCRSCNPDREPIGFGNESTITRKAGGLDLLASGVFSRP